MGFEAKESPTHTWSRCFDKLPTKKTYKCILGFILDESNLLSSKFLKQIKRGTKNRTNVFLLLLQHVKLAEMQKIMQASTHDKVKTSYFRDRPEIT